MVRNTMKLVKQADNFISEKYDIHAANINDIYEESYSKYDMIVNGFRFGYMQGIKAAKAKMMRGGVMV